MKKKGVIIFILSVLLLTGIWYGYREYTYYRKIRISEPGTGNITILIKPDDTATNAAANYLAYQLKKATGAETRIITETDEHFLGISIECDASIPEEAHEKAHIEFITVAEAANEEQSVPDYSIQLEKDGLHLLIPERENCFGVVKAITDRWLQEDCGLQDGINLCISRAMIDAQLLSLPIEVSGTVRVLTQNLCYSDDGEGKTVEERAERFIRLVEEYQPDLIGTQECSWQWLQLLQERLGDRYSLYGESRSGPSTPNGERDVILFRKERFELKDGETFWLSPTPSEANSKLNYSGPPRICTWGLLMDKETKKNILFSNTHLQNGYKEEYGDVREQQTEILLRRLRKGSNYLASYPGFLTGDFNGVPEETFYSLVKETYEDAQKSAITDLSNVTYSFHDYGRVQYLLDYCFFSPESVTVLNYQILDDQYGGYISDHFGILVTAYIN